MLNTQQVDTDTSQKFNDFGRIENPEFREAFGRDHELLPDDYDPVVIRELYARTDPRKGIGVSPSKEPAIRFGIDSKSLVQEVIGLAPFYSGPLADVSDHDQENCDVCNPRPLQGDRGFKTRRLDFSEAPTVRDPMGSYGCP